MRAGRDALVFLASRLSGFEFFVGAQERGLQAGVVRTPAEVLQDPHLLGRGWPVEADLPASGGRVTYPGPWYRSTKTPWGVRRAPLLGEHQDQVLRELGSSGGLDATGGTETA
jgi:formyl-CoA transferase